MGLPAQSVDVFLSNNDSRPAAHQGVMGRIRSLTNGITTHFQPGTPTMPARFSVEPRRAFQSLVQTSKDQLGVSLTPNWLDPSYLETVDGQLVSVDSRIPKVWNGYDYWVDYRDTVKVLTNKLREDTIVGGYGTIQCPDSSVLGHVEAVCYTLSNSSVWIGFREAPGTAGSVRRANDLASTWLVPPYAVTGITADPLVSHVINDGTNFYMFFDKDNTVEFKVMAFDGNGKFLDDATFAKADTTKRPGYWDITEAIDTDPDHPHPIIHVQPAGDTDVTTVDVNVTFTKVTFAAGAIVTSQVTDATIICNSRCEFLKNEFDGTKLYLVTTGPGTGDIRTRLYQVDEATLTQDAVYDIADPALTAGDIDSITGHVLDESGLSAYVLVTYLEPEETVGPRWDPQTRYIQTYHRTTGAVTTVRKSGSQALVSRSFKVGDGSADDWLTANFYQSGSGLDDTASIINYEIQPGDYFSGSQKQTVNVAIGDFTYGAPFTVTGTSIPAGASTTFVTAGSVSHIIQAGDTVAFATSSLPAGVPDGATLIKWTIAAHALAGNYTGARFTVAGSSIPSANDTWDIISASGSVIYTLPTSVSGTTVVAGTFGLAGTAATVQMTVWGFQDLGDNVPDPNAAGLLVGGTMTVTQAGNGGAKTIARVTVFSGNSYSAFFNNNVIWTVTAGESTTTASSSAVITVTLNNTWALEQAHSYPAAALDGGTLTVTDDSAVPGNNLTATITSAGSGGHIVTANSDGAAARAQVFTTPLPNITVELGPDSPAYTFLLQDLVAELTTNPYRFIGALVQLNSSNPKASGTYRITGYDPALTGIIYTEPTTTGLDIQAELLADPPENLTIFLPVSNAAPFQPTYFLTPVKGKRATVGMLDRLSAYNNWRQRGTNLMHGHLTNVETLSNGYSLVLPTTQERVATVNTNQQIAGTGTVGIKQWTILTDTGHGVDKYIPGCQAVTFEKDQFPDDGFPLAMEAPWLISTGTDTDVTQPGLQPLGTYVYSVQLQSQDSAGGRIFSAPSPPLTVSLTGTKNQITIGGDLPVPWDITPNVTIPGYYGVTNRFPVTIVVTRTSYINGVPTTTRYTVTSDLLPNETAPVSTSNPSGFSFTSQTNNLQWEYIDQNPDSTVQVNEQDYSQSFLPRFGLPAYSDICQWNDRYWFIMSDGSLGFTTPITDNVRPNWFPGFKVAAPPGERAVTIRPLQQFLIVTCERGTWYLPATALPNAALIDVGQVTVPSLIPLPFTNGGTGQALTSAAGVLYSSTAGGVWNVTRSLTNDFMSEPMVDEFKAMELDSRKVQSMVIDQDQRMAVSTGTTVIVYDLISGLWAEHLLPNDMDAGKLCIFDGNVHVRSGQYVLEQVTQPADQVGNTTYPIDWDIDMAGLSFGSVRAFQRLWRLQVIGQYKGPHNQTVTFTYPDDFPADPTFCPAIAPDPAKPYLIEAIPGHGKAGQFGVHIAIDHDGHPSGASCTIELLAAKVGIQPGQKQVPSGQRV